VLLGVEPEIEIGGLQNDRHAVVQAGHQVVGPRGKNGAGLKSLRAVLAFPAIPQPGESQRLAVLPENVVRLLFFLPFLPFEEAAGRNQAAPVPKGGAKSRGRMGGFGTGIDGLKSDRRLLRPEGDQPPLQQGQGPLPLDHPHRWHRLRRSDVVTGLQCGGLPGEMEIPEEFLEAEDDRISAAHDKSLPAICPNDRVAVNFGQLLIRVALECSKYL